MGSSLDDRPCSHGADILVGEADSEESTHTQCVVSAVRNEAEKGSMGSDTGQEQGYGAHTGVEGRRQTAVCKSVRRKLQEVATTSAKALRLGIYRI